jgi:chromosome segregation ATPase
VSTHAELKSLEVQKSELSSELSRLRVKERELIEELRQKTAKLSEVNKSIERLRRKTHGIIVTEHALLRYLERVMNLDMEDLKRDICGVDPSSLQLEGNVTFPVGQTHRIVVRDNSVVTVLTKDGQQF